LGDIYYIENCNLALAKSQKAAVFFLRSPFFRLLPFYVLATIQAAISVTRRMGAKQLVLAPGNAWTGCHAWTEGKEPSSALVHLMRNPINNTAIVTTSAAFTQEGKG
jgi:endoglucanase